MTAILPDAPPSNELHVLRLSGEESPIINSLVESASSAEAESIAESIKVPTSESAAAPAPVDARTHNADVHPVAGNADPLTKEADEQEQGFREQVSQIHLGK